MRRMILIASLSCLLFGSMCFGAQVPEGFYSYRVQEGDTLGKVFPKWTWEAIEMMNRIDPEHLPAGQDIIVPSSPDAKIPCPVPKSLSSDKTEPRSIHAFLDWQYFGAYEYGKLVFWGPISSGSGKKGRYTPSGQYRITVKDRWHTSKNPESYGAKMYFGLKLGRTNIWFHEQAMPGKPASHGCVRTRLKDARRLFAWARIGDLVIIHR